MWTSLRELYTSKAASEVTSETYWVGDAQAISLHLLGSPSTTTVQGTNVDGRASAIADTAWSTITVVGAGLYDIEPGIRWLRCQRSETTGAYLSLQQPWAR